MNRKDEVYKLSLPEWMDEEINNDELGKINNYGGRHKFLSKNIYQLRKAIQEVLVTEYYARKSGVLQYLDPRTKLFSLILLLIMVNFTRDIRVLLGCWVFTVILMLRSCLPVIRLQKHIWGFIPLITLLISLPATVNIIVEGTPLLLLYHSANPLTFLGVNLPDNIYITRQGSMAVLILFLRVGISLSLGVILTMTTPAAKILKSLKILGVPALFIMIIEISYRYLVILLNISVEMFEARYLRTVANLSLGKKQAQVGTLIAALFTRSLVIADEVYLAMTARCYTGDPVSIDNFKFGKADIITGFLMITIFISILIKGG